jgi:cobalt-zinc-cadmium efflux system membrane fusion protein
VRVLLLLAALTIAGCGGATTEEIETTSKVTVAVDVVRQGTIRATLRATGVVKPAPGAELLVLAPEPARIVELPRAAGDPVRRGDLLVRFEVPSLQADAAGRKADLARAQARIETARAAVERTEGLFSRGIAAKREVEDARRELSDAQADLAGAKGALSATATLAARATVRAPFAGVVAERWHNPGDLVEAAASDPILRLIDPARLQVEVSIPLADLAGVAIGSPVRVLASGVSNPLEGTVVSRPVAVDPMTGAATVRVSLPGLAIPGSSSLPAGSPVAVEILSEEHRGVMFVPVAAVVEEGPHSFAYVVDSGGHAHRRPVVLGISSDREVEVRSGLAVGDRVIVQGQASLPDGAEVTVVPEGSGEGPGR